MAAGHVYDGDGEVPPQIHDYLSQQYHDLRGLSKTDPKLVSRARGRWYVPNPAKQADIDKLRARAEREAAADAGADSGEDRAVGRADEPLTGERGADLLHAFSLLRGPGAHHR